MKSADKECYPYPWVIDSGASSHMTKEKHVLMNFREFGEPENGRFVKGLGSGSVRINMLFQAAEHKKAVLYNMLYVPERNCNLFFVRASVA